MRAVPPSFDPPAGLWQRLVDCIAEDFASSVEAAPMVEARIRGREL